MNEIEKGYHEFIDKEAVGYAITLRKDYGIRPMEATPLQGNIVSLSHTLWLIETFILDPTTSLVDKLQTIGFVRRALLGSGVYPQAHVNTPKPEAKTPIIERIMALVENGDQQHGDAFKEILEREIQAHYFKKAEGHTEENPSKKFSVS